MYSSNPNVQRYLAMEPELHAAALLRLQETSESTENPELLAAEEAMTIREKNTGSGETSDHPHVDGTPEIA